MSKLDSVEKVYSEKCYSLLHPFPPHIPPPTPSSLFSGLPFVFVFEKINAHICTFSFFFPPLTQKVAFYIRIFHTLLFSLNNLSWKSFSNQFKEISLLFTAA